MTKFAELTEDLALQLKAIVGEDDIQYGEGVNEDYSHDEMPIYGAKMPQAVVFPENTEEVAAIMKLCYDNDIPVTVRGAGTGLVGGSTPLAGGVVLCTMNMNKILEYDMRNLNVRIQPGVRLCDLAADALEHDLLYPPDPGEKTGSVGGNVSTNAGGMRAVKYGTTRDYVMAMTVVLPTGEILEVGRAVNKTSSGYSLLHMIIGSEGTLAVITELTMKLVPNPQANTSFILPFENIDAAIRTVPEIKLAGLGPQSIEFMERDIVDASAVYLGKSVFPTEIDGREAGAYILVTLDGNDPEEIFQRAEKLVEVADANGAYDVLVVDHAAEKEAVWAARSAFLTVIEADSDLLDEMDVVVPVDSIADFLHYIYGVGEELGVRIRSFGHAGDGNLHIYCAGNDIPVDEFLAKSTKVMEAAYAKCAELRGQVSGEHGIGHAKKKYLHESVGDTAINLMAGIKKVFDPKGLLNPGKICTDL
ncbi:MAG: FAD-binding oxidoreductase [Coriobacteriaceae bacterium]|nr:FAD-binding oxidoreductase [Coriobacteriaceae bacterium]